MGISNVAVVIIVLVAIYFAYILSRRHEINWSIMDTYMSHPMCHKVGEGVLYGPEDMTFAGDNIVFVSSHDRRNLLSSGTIFTVNTKNERVAQCLFDQVPPSFRPHGIAVAECEGHSRLFVISHRFSGEYWHAIEVFDYTPGKSVTTLKHVKTLTSQHLVSPNDLIALNCEELIVSNDHGTDFIPQMIFDDLFRRRTANMVHFDGHQWAPISAPPDAAFGNGLVLRQGAEGQEYLIRSSCIDFSLLTYAIRRGGGGEGTGGGRGGSTVELELLHEEKLPFAPDNIEHDKTSGGILITGHPSTSDVVLHALFKTPSPSVAVLYYGMGNYSTVYYAPKGLEISGSSVAVRSTDQKLFIGQICDPYILVCEPYDDNEAGYDEREG